MFNFPTFYIADVPLQITALPFALSSFSWSDTDCVYATPSVTARANLRPGDVCNFSSVKHRLKKRKPWSTTSKL